MSRRNGDRARFQKDRKRKMRRRQRTRALLGALGAKAKTEPGATAQKDVDVDNT
jgi:hypothetical protein